MLKPFAYHKPTLKTSQKVTKLREAFSALSETIADNCPASRETSTALTNLETAAMWAIKSAVFNDPDSEIVE